MRVLRNLPVAPDGRRRQSVNGADGAASGRIGPTNGGCAGLSSRRSEFAQVEFAQVEFAQVEFAQVQVIIDDEHLQAGRRLDGSLDAHTRHATPIM